MKVTRMSHIGLQVMSPNMTCIVEEQHVVYCRACEFGFVKRWFGLSYEKCPMCDGSGILSTYSTFKTIR